MNWRVNVLDMFVIPKLIHIFRSITVTNKDSQILWILKKCDSDFEVHVVKQNTQHSQHNVEDKEQSQRAHITGIQDLLNSYNNYDSMVLGGNRYMEECNRLDSSEI